MDFIQIHVKKVEVSHQPSLPIQSFEFLVKLHYINSFFASDVTNFLAKKLKQFHRKLTGIAI